jgi:hypothetical protein
MTTILQVGGFVAVYVLVCWAMAWAYRAERKSDR